MNSRGTRIGLIVGVIVGAYWFFLGRPSAVPNAQREDVEAWPEEAHDAENAVPPLPDARAAEVAPSSRSSASTSQTPGAHPLAADAIRQTGAAVAVAGVTSDVSLQQEFQNLATSARKGAVAGVGIPFMTELKRGRACGKDLRGEWILGGDAPEDYEVVVQDGFVGLRGLTPKAGMDVEVNRCGPVSTAAGKLLKFSMWVKAAGVTDYANIHVRAFGEHGERLVWNDNNNKGFRDTFDWKLLSVEVGIPEESTDLQVGITFESPGRAWFHSPTIQILE